MSTKNRNAKNHTEQEEMLVGENTDAQEETLVGENTEQRSVNVARDTLSKQAKVYLAGSVARLRRAPSPALSPGFRARLLSFKSLLDHAAKHATPAAAVIDTALALAMNAKVDAFIFVRQVMQGVTWQASIDVTKARRIADGRLRDRPVADHREDVQAPWGLGDDWKEPIGDVGEAIMGFSDTESYVDEETALSGLVEVNGFLTTVVDTLFPDEADREYYRLTDGLPYIDVPQERGGATIWVPVFDPVQAIEHQIVINAARMKERERRALINAAQALTNLKALYGAE